MKNFIKSVLAQSWLMMLGMYIVALLGILFPSFAEWPFVPVVFIALIPTFVKHVDAPRWDRFAAMVIGALSIQILFWVG